MEGCAGADGRLRLYVSGGAVVCGDGVVTLAGLDVSRNGDLGLGIILLSILTISFYFF